MKKRFNLNEVLPTGYKQLLELDKYVSGIDFDKIQQELVKIRTSQINGCAFCLNMHIKDALKYGEDPKRIYVLSAWREAINWFSEEDQAILTLTEEVTLIANGGLRDETYEKAVQLFGEERTGQLIMAVIGINSWNRVGVALNLHP